MLPQCTHESQYTAHMLYRVIFDIEDKDGLRKYFESAGREYHGFFNSNFESSKDVIFLTT